MNLLFILEMIFLVLQTIKDVKTQKLDLWEMVIFLTAGLLLKIFWLREGVWEIIPGMSVGIIMLGISYLTEEAMGYGDGMVVLVTGVLCGIKTVLLTIYIAFFLMSILALWLLIKKGFSYKARIPFVPCILAGFLGGIIL